MRPRLPPSMRGASTTPLLSLFLVVVIAVLSYLGVAAPTLLADGLTATIHRAVATVPELSRWPSATTPGLPAFTTGSDGEAGVWGTAVAALEEHRQEQPEPLRGLLGEPRLVIAVDPSPTVDEDPERVGPVPSNRVGLVSDPGFIDRVDLVEGRLPEVTDPADGIEMVLTESVADQLNWQSGTQRRWEDTTLTLTGVVAPSGRDDGDWPFISGAAEPIVEVDANGDRVLVAAGFMHVDEVAAFTGRISDIKVTSWMPLDADAIDAASAAAVAAQLRLLTATPAEIEMYDRTFYNRGLPFSSALPQAIDTGTARGDAMTSVITVAAVGPISVALVVLILVSRLIALRRVASARVLQARGASAGRLTAMLGGEGAVLGVLGAALGAGIAAVRPGWSGGWGVIIPAVLAAVPALVLPWGALTDAARRGRGDLGERSRTGAARMVLELLILAVTALLAALILTRSAAGAADPLLLAVPVLLGASGGVLALRLLPVLLGLAERRGRRRASLSALLGPARARRSPVVRMAPVLGVVVGLGVAVFSVAFVSTVSDGVERSAAISVGADVRVDAAYIGADGAERVAALDGVRMMAALRGDSSVEASAGPQTARAHLYTIDRDDFVAVQRDSETAIPLPPALADQADGSVPVVISEGLLVHLGLDDPEDLEVAGTPVSVVATAPSQVPFGSAEQWVIVDEVNAAALGERGTGSSRLYLDVISGADPDVVGAEAVATLGGDAAFETPSRVVATYADDPAFSVVRGALLAASVIVAVLLTVGVVATLVLGAPSRARMLAILRTLGHRHRAAGRLVAWEVTPALLTAVPFGVGAGAAMSWLVIPQLDLRGFVGGPAQPSVQSGGAWQLLVVGGFALIATAAVFTASVLASRARAVDTVSTDDEPGER